MEWGVGAVERGAVGSFVTTGTRNGVSSEGRYGRNRESLSDDFPESRFYRESPTQNFHRARVAAETQRERSVNRDGSEEQNLTVMLAIFNVVLGQVQQRLDALEVKQRPEIVRPVAMSDNVMCQREWSHNATVGGSDGLSVQTGVGPCNYSVVDRNDRPVGMNVDNWEGDWSHVATGGNSQSSSLLECRPTRHSKLSNF